jgi:uncharacterized protein YjbI with pentapeptide repeats
MSIEKKSLISTLKTTKKANVASTASGEGFVKSESINPKRATMKRATLKRATLKRATMKRATLKRATLKRATLKRAPIS